MSPSALLRIILLLGGAIAFVLLTWLRRSSGRASIAANSDASIGSLAADQQTLLALRNAGADPTKATEAHFYLYFPTKGAFDSLTLAVRRTRTWPALKDTVLAG